MAAAKASKTVENLKFAFAGESQARNKYDYFAKAARNEDHGAIALIFEETAGNEMQHAKEEFKRLHGIGGTAENLKAAIEGEHYETSQMYPSFAKQALEDGDEDAANLFTQLAKVEAVHEARYKKILKRLEEGTLYKREKPIYWKCTKCGFVHHGAEAPEKCPSCGHPQGYYWPLDASDL